MKASGINKFGKIMAILSFGFGTFLFLLYLVFDSPILIGVLAFVYFLISTFLNLGTLAVLLINAIANSDHRKNTIMTAALLIINIPIQILYFFYCL
jgi:hypothetical protein